MKKILIIIFAIAIIAAALLLSQHKATEDGMEYAADAIEAPTETQLETIDPSLVTDPENYYIDDGAIDGWDAGVLAQYGLGDLAELSDERAEIYSFTDAASTVIIWSCRDFSVGEEYAKTVFDEVKKSASAIYKYGVDYEIGEPRAFDMIDSLSDAVSSSADGYITYWYAYDIDDRRFVLKYAVDPERITLSVNQE